ncbi:hypothetical protein [Yinghuangia seranimata]|uniref:hypothetical protein n=1 Tax=Yinghuangia seranimata TaxID=408067 RepID=UPI00248D03C2|nr:hypothetical protein [Yinghuangia seranimata]MDI2127777.1 hypothetical protein [Yinghuangia seranimata]
MALEFWEDDEDRYCLSEISLHDGERSFELSRARHGPAAWAGTPYADDLLPGQAVVTVVQHGPDHYEPDETPAPMLYCDSETWIPMAVMQWFTERVAARLAEAAKP